MRIAFVVGHTHNQKATYTTLHLAFEASRLQHEVFFCHFSEMTLTQKGALLSKGFLPTSFENIESYTNSLKEKQTKEIDLSNFDVVFFRTNFHEFNPDFKNTLFLIAEILESKGVKVINQAAGLKNTASKLYTFFLPQTIRPKSILTRSHTEVIRFATELNSSIVVKPLSGFGGKKVFLIKNEQDPNLKTIVSEIAKKDYILVEEYIQEAKNGDKRLLLINGRPIKMGEFCSIYRRKSSDHDFRNNVHVGGLCYSENLSQEMQLILDTLEPLLVKDGIQIAGVDIAGNKVIEINGLCPGGIENMNRLYNCNLAKIILEDLLA